MTTADLIRADSAEGLTPAEIVAKRGVRMHHVTSALTAGKRTGRPKTKKRCQHCGALPSHQVYRQP